jgi:hypothetical protein
MCEYNSTFGHGLGLVFEKAELSLGSLLASSTRHPDETVVEALVEHRKLQSRIASCLFPRFTFSLALSSPWVANRITRTINILLGVRVYCDSDEGSTVSTSA